MSTTLKAIRDDSEFKKYKRILAKAQETLDFDALRGEVLSLHSSRLSRTLHGGRRTGPMAISDALLQDLSTRARFTEIRVRASRVNSHVEEAIKATRRYLSTEYADDLSEFTYSDQRKAFVDRVLRQGIAFVADTNSLVDSIDLLIKDIDQAGFALRNCVEVLKLMAEGKGRTV